MNAIFFDNRRARGMQRGRRPFGLEQALRRRCSFSETARRAMTVRALAAATAMAAGCLARVLHAQTSVPAPLTLENRHVAVAFDPQHGAVRSIRNKELNASYALAGIGFEVVNAGVCLLGAAFIKRTVPETKRKTLEQIERELNIS